jgi:hypothetical protein
VNRWSIFSILVVAIAGSCATKESSNLSLCETVESVVDKMPSLQDSRVSVCGYLIYKAEDRNLYGSQAAAANFDRRSCLAVGYTGELGAKLREASGMWVRVRGVVTSEFCPEETVCMASCSQKGIFIDSIERNVEHARKAEAVDNFLVKKLRSGS